MRDQQQYLHGQWIGLEPVSEHNSHDIEHLCQKMSLSAEVGDVFRYSVEHMTSETWGFGKPLAIRVHEDNQVIGIITNGKLSEYNGVSAIHFSTVYHPHRLICVVEALKLYVDYMFEQGARKCQVQVLEFNKPMLKFMYLLDQPVQARLRQHKYIAGNFWDLLIFGFTHSEWRVARKRVEDCFPDEKQQVSAADGVRQMMRSIASIKGER